MTVFLLFLYFAKANALIVPDKMTFDITERTDSADVYTDGALAGHLSGMLRIALSAKKLRLLTRRTTVGSLELLL